MQSEVDPDSPVPLYHQIAQAIRSQLERGELREGDALEPMRQAAERWGVNLHTVRHAYAALAREGLLEMRSARGTRVTREAALLQREPLVDVDAFIERILREAANRFGLDATALAARIGAVGRRRRPVVAVLECSIWQCRSHAEEIAQRWDVEVRPWPLSIETEPEGDAVLATYFHYNDIRRRWPHLLEHVRFVTIRPDRALRDWLGEAESVVLVERDGPTAEAVAADLQAVLGRDLAVRLAVTDDPVTTIQRHEGERVLCSPRVWSDLPEAIRSHTWCAVVRYEFDRSELETVARDLRWPRVESRVGVAS